MSLRSSLGNVLRENGQIYGTDLKKLREYSAGNFEGMYSEPDPEMDTLLGDVQMEAIENEGFMSDELPKFSKGGSIFKKTKDFRDFREDAPANATGTAVAGTGTNLKTVLLVEE